MRVAKDLPGRSILGEISRPKRLLTTLGIAGGVALAVGMPLCEQAAGQSKKPNILVIFGDDIGMWNIGAYTHGMMGRTPNIDSLARSGAIFTDHYGQASCTAGRAAFIMGHPRYLERDAATRPDSRQVSAGISEVRLSFILDDEGTEAQSLNI